MSCILWDGCYVSMSLEVNFVVPASWMVVVFLMSCFNVLLSLTRACSFDHCSSVLVNDQCFDQ